MHKLSQKVVASGLSLALVVGLTPLPAYAADSTLQAGTAQLSTQVVQKSIDDDNLTFSTPTKHIFDGNVFKPVPTITWNGVTLVENVDYTLEYQKNTYTYSYDDEYGYTSWVAVTDPVETGSYRVVATGINAYSGTAYGSFSISEKSTDYSLSFRFTDAANASGYSSYGSATYYYTGGPIEPQFVVLKHDSNTDAYTPLTRNVDYTVKYTQEKWDEATGEYVETEFAAPTELGYYEIQITYIGAYAQDGTDSRSFRIADPKKLTYGDAYFPEQSVFSYTGSAINPKPVVLKNGVRLTEGADYVLKYQQTDSELGAIPVVPQEPGDYTCVVEGLGTYAGTTDNPSQAEVPFTIVKGNNLAEGYTDTFFTSGSVVAYTGSAVTPPKPLVTYKGKALVEGRDYTVTTEAEQVIDEGTYTLFINGIGNYYGTTTTYFQVFNRNSASLYNTSVIMPDRGNSASSYAYTFTGKAIKPKPSKVQLANEGKTLKEGTDYTVAYRTADGDAAIDQPIEVGDYYMVLLGAGAYVGQTRTVFFSIVEKNDFRAATVSMDSLYTYNGKAVKPVPTVVLAGKKLKKGKDYTVAYYTSNDADYLNGFAGQKKISSPKNAGSYSVVILPKGSKYTGAITDGFTIKAASMSNDEVSVTLKKESLAYTGKKDLKPTVVVKVNNKKVAATNYTVSYPLASKAMGIYTVNVSGKHNLEGSKTLTYTVGPKDSKITKLTASAKGFTAKWKKIAKKNKGYQVRYSVNKDMSKAKTKTVKKAKKTSLKVSKLKSNTTYYVQVRTMTKANGQTIYGNWSKAKTVTTK